MEDHTMKNYTIKLSGSLEEDFIAAYCPFGTKFMSDNEATILSNISTDQSGIIGLLRGLHNLGCTFLEIKVEKIVT